LNGRRLRHSRKCARDIHAPHVTAHVKAKSSQAQPPSAAIG